MALVAVAIASGEAVRADGIDATSIRSFSFAGNSNNSANDSDSDSTAAVPWTLATSATYGDNDADMSTVVSTSQVVHTTTWETDGAYPNQANTNASAYFTADGNVSYSITGSSGFSGGAGTTSWSVFLLDLTDNLMVSQTSNYSQNVNGASFTAGSESGATSNTLVGSLTGTLIHGHSYQFFMGGYVYDYPASTTTDPLSPLSGSSTATLTIGTSAVPEPGSLALLGLGLVGLALHRRRRRVAN